MPLLLLDIKLVRLLHTTPAQTRCPCPSPLLTKRAYSTLAFFSAVAGVQGFHPSFQGWVDQAHLVINTTIDEWYPGVPIFAYGESLGSAVLLMLLSQSPELQQKLAGVITAGAVLKVGVLPPPAMVTMLRVVAKVAPFVSVPGDKTTDPEHYASAFGNKTWAEKAFADPLIVKDVKLGMMPVVLDTLLALPNRVRDIVDVPVLVLHGKNDTRADYSGSEELVEHLGSGDKQLTLYEGMQHQLLQGVNEDVQRVLRDMGDWMMAKLH